MEIYLYKILFGNPTKETKIILKMKTKRVFISRSPKPNGWSLQLGAIAPCGVPLIIYSINSEAFL
tara:strand:- start:309 stop:503 length:195 start_codon:yes stop_codon:yes gene_type:complete